MEQDLKRLMQIGAGRTLHQPDLKRALQVGRRQRVTRRLMVMATSLAVVVGGYMAIESGRNVISRGGPDTEAAGKPAPNSSTPANADNYNFSEIEVQHDASAGLAIVRFRSSWTGVSFPGTHLCRWEVVGPDGTVIGESETAFFADEPSQSGQEEVRVRDEPTSARIVCEPERLDNPGPGPDPTPTRGP